jgi:glycosyltransferase involved in cell wall biosynthesis
MNAKIGLFVASLGGGGAERVMVTIANNLAGRSIETQMIIAAPDLTYAEELAPKVNLINLHTHRMLRTVLPLARYFRKERPDALLTTLVEANITAVVARSLARVPVRLVVREANTPAHDLLGNPSWKKRFTGRLLCHFYRRADAVIANSAGVYRDLVERMRLPASKVHLIRNPVSLRTIYAKMEEPVDHPWFRSGAPPVILSVGRLEHAKDYPTLLRAFAHVRHEIEAHLLILGEGSQRKALQYLAEQLGISSSVQMPGFEPNPFRYMRRARLYVMSSRYEGFPNALVQALACGCPVISTDCESGPRDILNNGQYGWLVPVGDATQLAHTILTALNQPLISVPCEWIEQFDETHVVDQILQLLLESPPS